MMSTLCVIHVIIQIPSQTEQILEAAEALFTSQPLFLEHSAHRYRSYVIRIPITCSFCIPFHLYANNTARIAWKSDNPLPFPSLVIGVYPLVGSFYPVLENFL